MPAKSLLPADRCASPSPRRDIVVRTLSRGSNRGILDCRGLIVPCVLGRGGRQVRKREGDGATPVGQWAIRAVYYRSDRGACPRSPVGARTIRPDDGWCDAAGDRNYNRWVRHPYPASAEMLWREDGLYDIVVVLGYNDRPRRRGRGSAIFMHLARGERTPTQGCIALQPRDLRLVLERIGRGACVSVPA